MLHNQHWYTFADSSKCNETAPLSGQAGQELVQRCNLQPCPSSFFVFSPWQPCDVTCGLGHQTRSATCTQEGAIPVANVHCRGTIPLNRQVQSMALLISITALFVSVLWLYHLMLCSLFVPIDSSPPVYWLSSGCVALYFYLSMHNLSICLMCLMVHHARSSLLSKWYVAETYGRPVCKAQEIYDGIGSS
jgi:hypothetical protein